MRKRVISLFTALAVIISTLFYSFSAYATETVGINTFTELKAAFSSDADASYVLEKDIVVRNCGITSNVELNGAGYMFDCIESTSNATIYQNDNVNSSFSDIIISGNKKPEVGIWQGAGTMTFTDSKINNFNITTVRYSAIALGSSSRLILNNVAFSNNSAYDIYLCDSASVNINKGTTLNKIHITSIAAKINIGSDWNGSFEITLDNPTCRPIGTVAQGADVSGITVSNDGYYVENVDGKLTVKSTNERAIRFDMSQREALYKGSTGFLYGEAEINVPSIDLLQGLKPDTMVQKAVGGLQHPTGDAVRTKSALTSAGVRDMQVYFQDIYLEWPYDAPVKDGTIDLDSYQKTVEQILYSMICDDSKATDTNAFLGSDGKYYTLNEEAAKNYSYVLFNEPDQIWYGGNLEGLENAWKKIYTAVHTIDENARCVGPNFSGFNEESYDHFLNFCYENNCLPEVISWHELGDISLTDFYKHYDCVKAAQSKYYTDDYAQKSGRSYQPELIVNEYARHYDIGSPGGLVKWLAMFEDKDMSGCMAYWAMANSLNEMASDQNSPTSTWWVYHWYAQMTGKQCPLTYPAFDETRLYGVASYDEDINMGYVIFGGNEDVNGSESVYLDNIGSTNLASSSDLVNVKLYGVSFSGQQGSEYSPECIFEGSVATDNGALKLKVVNTDEMDAYFAVLTQPDDNAKEVEMSNVQLSTDTYEAENATLIGGATAYSKIGWSTFATSGRADVGNINNNGDGVQFDISVAESGDYSLSLFYSLQAPYVNPQTLETDANGQNRGIGQTLPFGVSVDGSEAMTIYLDSTVTWSYKNHYDLDLYLTEGNHTVTFKQINGNEGNKGNIQLVAALDKLDVTRIENQSTRNDFEIDLTQMSNFKDGNGYKVTAIAPVAGYYNITADGDITLTRQSVDYAPDANTYSECSVYDNEISSTVYLSQGANTIGVTGDATRLYFNYDSDKTEQCTTVVYADDMTLHGNNPIYKVNSYAQSGKVISNVGIGQNESGYESGAHNYIVFSVNADTEGVYNLAIRYANNEPAPVMQKSNGDTYVHPYNIDLVERYAQISVNGGEAETVYFRNTLSWDTFKTVNIQVKLNAGLNTIRIYNDNSYQFSSLVNSSAPEIDTITIAKQSYDSSTVTKQSKTADVKHNYITSTETTKATASSNGKVVTTYTCTDCGYSYSKTTLTIYYPKTITLSATSYTYDGSAKKPTVTVKDSAGKTISSSNYTVAYSNNVNAGTATATITFKGNYTGTVKKTYTIKKRALSSSNSTVTLSATSYTYNGKVKTPSVTVKYGSKKLVKGTDYTVTYSSGRKNVGKYNVKITFKGNYSGTITKTFTIKPKNTSISSVTAKSKGFTVKWKKYTTQTTGYQIQYSTSSKFTNAKTVTITKNSTTSKTITKLSAKKKYYVRIRTYKTVSGTKYYSAWSSAKSVTTKK